MMYSLGEIEVHAKKAVRGAGFEWGFAEEAGKAVRWLEQQHLPGMKVLADYLSAYDHDSSRFVAPDVDFSLVSQADTEALLSEPASFIHSSIEVFEETVYSIFLGRYFAVVFPITIAFKLSFH